MFPRVRLLSMSELEGTLRGNAEDSAADLSDWEDDEVRIDLTDPVAEVLDTTEEEEDVEVECILIVTDKCFAHP